MSRNIIDEKLDELKEELDLVEEKVLTSYTLADAMRDGCKVTDKAENWGNGNTACAMSAGYLAGKARGYIEK